ncbi:hypothetical protein DRO33_01280 [Candidatus Bathyarchaeota archaeon]|nr:MAG: hypothetical protein DRO33_01280 [Candidatus Bathyarchaeota archaeon]
MSRARLGIKALEPPEEQVRALIRPLLKKKGLIKRRPVEEVAFRAVLYFPYDIVDFDYELADGSRGRGRTAINLVLAASAEDPRELTLCLRPSYAREAQRASELPGDARLVGPKVRGLEVLRRLADARAEVEEFRSRAGRALADARRKTILPQYQIVSLFVPVPSIQAMMAQRSFSDLYARVEAFVRELNSRLGLEEEVELTAIEPREQEGPIYFPSLVLGLSGPEGTRLVFLDISGREPRLDVEATYLCSIKPGLREELQGALSA